MMTQEAAQYIINHYADLLPLKERTAFNHYHHALKLEGDPKKEAKEKMMLRTGWLSNQKDVLDLLANGYEYFVFNSAKKILKVHPDGVFFNRCPKCDHLARTPFAKQCRYCYHDWH